MYLVALDDKSKVFGILNEYNIAELIAHKYANTFDGVCVFEVSGEWIVNDLYGEMSIGSVDLGDPILYIPFKYYYLKMHNGQEIARYRTYNDARYGASDYFKRTKWRQHLLIVHDGDVINELSYIKNFGLVNC